MTIDQHVMARALRVEDFDFSDEEVLVRDSFDAFFGQLQMFEHFIQIGLLVVGDVAYPASYYRWRMQDHWDVFELYLVTYSFDKARAFLGRGELTTLLEEKGQPPHHAV